MDGIFYEDLKVGDRFNSEKYKVTKESIIAFAREFDVQAFHLNEAAAKKSLFGGLAASGWQTAAIAMRLFTTTIPFADGAVGLGVDELRWPIAVRPNDRLQLETEILEMRPSKSQPQRGIIRIRNVMRNQKEEEVLSYMANAIITRRLTSG